MTTTHETYDLDPETGEATGTVHFYCSEHAPTGAVRQEPPTDDTRCEHPDHEEGQA